MRLLLKRFLIIMLKSRCQSAQHIQLLYKFGSKTGILLGTGKSAQSQGRCALHVGGLGFLFVIIGIVPLLTIGCLKLFFTLCLSLAGRIPASLLLSLLRRIACRSLRLLQSCTRTCSAYLQKGTGLSPERCSVL